MSNSIDTKDMTEQEWLKQRMSSIGGSDAADLLGKSKYKDPYDVYLSKVEDGNSFDGNKHTRYGHLMEPIIADVFEQESGCKVRKCHRMVIDGEHDHIHANIDRQIVGTGPEDSTGILECKATQPFVENEWIYDIDPSWYIQLQHYLMLFGYEYGYISWESDREFKYMRFEADPELHEHLRKEYLNFWENHVIPENPPEPPSKEVNKYLKPIEGKVKTITDEEIFDLYLEMTEAKEKRLEWKKKQKELKDSLKLIAGDSEKLVYKFGEDDDDSQIIATQSYNEREYPQNKKEFKEEHPELYEKYIRTSGYTRTTFRKPKI